MSKSLVIVESPAKAKTINKFLGANYQVIACNGHIRDLPVKRIGVDVNDDFKPAYEIIKGKKRIVSEIKKKAELAKEVLLAADHDREGEAICWHLKSVIGKKAPVARVLFNEITKNAIQEAILKPSDICEPRVQAQQARRILDRLVGYMISPLLWSKVRAGLSAGRVQSVALRIICEREKEILAFVPEEYWNITASLVNHEQQDLEAKLVKINNKKAEIRNEAEAKKVVDESKAGNFIVEDVVKKKKQRKSPVPFTTSKLQQRATQKLGFSPKRTMMIAQQLYEGLDIGETTVGLITYMRTDSIRIAGEAVHECLAYIEKEYGRDYLPAKPKIFKNKKGAQDAHEAIRPTSLQRNPEKLKRHLSADQYKLYKLIWNCFIASQMKNAQVEMTTVNIKNGIYLYRITGQVILFDGYLRVYRENDDKEEGLLPKIEVKEELTLKEILPSQHFTKPPPRFTDATLVKELEENGIGRPSTYAAILDIIENRDYVKKEKRTFFPTEIGLKVSQLLTENFPDILNIKFTAEMEEKLDEVEVGKKESLDLLRQFYTPFDKALKEARENMTNLKKDLEEKTDIVCEKCGAVMVTRWGRNGKFIACPNFPKCKNTKSLEETLPESEKETPPVDIKCEKCGGQMIVKSSRYGKFLACENYPKCKNSKPMPTGTTCPNDGGGGDIGSMRSKKGRTYYGCSNYPKCDFRSWDKPVNRDCPECGNNYLVEKTTKAEGKNLICLNKDCNYKLPLSD